MLYYVGTQMEKTLSMNFPEIKVRETRGVHKNWDILARETNLYLFKDKEELKYCRESYVDGCGTRNYYKLVEKNFGFDERWKVVGYTTDGSRKVLRVFVNKYDLPEGDDVSESILWPPVLGKQSTLKYPGETNEGFYFG